MFKDVRDLSPPTRIGVSGTWGMPVTMYRHVRLDRLPRYTHGSEPRSRESWGILQATQNAREAESATQCNSTISASQLYTGPATY